MLYVGTIEPRKNLTRLMTAFAEARKAGHCARARVRRTVRMVVARSRRPHRTRSASSASVHFTGYVPFEDLPAIYNLGDFFVFPSLYEGFGLPVVEAMACGTPVITSNTSSLGEIAGDAAETIDPLDTEAMTDAIVRLATDADLRRDRSRARPAARPQLLVGADRAGDAGGVPARRRRRRRNRRRRRRSTPPISACR